MSSDHAIQIKAPGPRPAYYRVAEHLWGAGCNIDSDGDSRTPEDHDWTELSVSLRGAPGQQLDISPVSTEPLVLVVRSPQASLCSKAVKFIVSFSGGTVESIVPNNSFKPKPLRGPA
ncbi:hypothetical protein XarbCFBP8132_19775 [Xanthomonas arboricola]|nr:hypothetical protein XarbCFBP7614_19875 [Xanthomonas arboricola]PPT35787.1 hypothetical protein XarbCFBP8132_19775 [Xanthomonas arboricola]